MVFLHEAIVVYGRGNAPEFKILEEQLSPHLRSSGLSVVGEPNPLVVNGEFDRITPRYDNLVRKYGFDTDPSRSESDRLSMRYSYFKRRNVERRYVLDLWVQTEETQKLLPRLAAFSDIVESLLRQLNLGLWAVLSADDRITAAGATLREIRNEMRQQLLPAAKEYLLGLLPQELEMAVQISGAASKDDYLHALAGEVKKVVEGLPQAMPAVPRKAP
jgi:hypothetical protein